MVLWLCRLKYIYNRMERDTISRSIGPQIHGRRKVLAETSCQDMEGPQNEMPDVTEGGGRVFNGRHLQSHAKCSSGTP